MLLTLLKYLIYDKCIDVIASNIRYNFNPKPLSPIQFDDDDDTLRVGFGSIWEYNDEFNSAYEIPHNCNFIDDNTNISISYDFMYDDLMQQNKHLHHDTLLITINDMLSDDGDDDDGYDYYDDGDDDDEE